MYFSATISRALSNPTWDVVLILAMLAIGFFYGIYRGKKRIAATIIYTYVALAIYSVLPFEKITKFFSGTNEYFVKIGIFLILFILLSLLLGTKKGRGFRSGGSWWQIFLLSFVQIGFLVHLFFSFLPTEQVASLAPLTKNFFANSNYHLWWMAGPIIIVILLRRIDRG